MWICVILGFKIQSRYSSVNLNVANYAMGSETAIEGHDYVTSS